MKPRWHRQMLGEMLPIEEIRKLPLDALTLEEIARLSYAEWSEKVDELRARIAACPKHEKIGTGTADEARRGWHPGHCKHCGADMSIDSGD